MKTGQGSYAIVQFLPDPDRQEGINLGILLYDEDEQRVHVRFSEDLSGKFRGSNDINKSFVFVALEELQYRLKREVEKQPSIEALKRFRAMRSNNVRITPFLPVFAYDFDEEVQRLFEALVGDSKKKTRKQRVSIKLKSGLKKLNVLEKFDQHPDPVSLPRYRLKLKPDLAIRRERYNLIEAARFDEPERGLEQAGRHALAGRALRENLNMSLIVVGDFGSLPNDYFAAIKEDLERSDTQLFRVDRLDDMATQFTLH